MSNDIIPFPFPELFIDRPQQHEDMYLYILRCGWGIAKGYILGAHLPRGHIYGLSNLRKGVTLL